MVQRLEYDHWGLPVYDVDGEEWAVGTEEQAERGARDEILDSLWAFRPEFIARFIGIDDRRLVDALRKMQEELSEDSNPLVRRIIGEDNLDEFVRQAIEADGLGHFLSSYDGETHDSDEIEGLPPGLLAFRVN